MTIMGLDYASGRPSGASIIAAGYTFVCRYLTDGGPGLPGKLLLPAEADDLRSAGVEIVSNWETTADRLDAGYDAGCYDAEAGLAVVLSCGGSADRPIYFSADWDATPQDQGPIDDYLRGAATVIGAPQVGIYGGFYVCSRALDGGTAVWAWQSVAWSGGQEDPRINIFQDNNAGYAYIEGVDCDIDEARTPDYGQWSLAGKQPQHGGTDMSWDAPIKNFHGDLPTAGEMLSWIDKRSARNEALLAQLLDNSTTPGAAQAFMDKWDADHDEKTT